jgi:hypothetical protein
MAIDPLQSTPSLSSSTPYTLRWYPQQWIWSVLWKYCLHLLSYQTGSHLTRVSDLIRKFPLFAFLGFNTYVTIFSIIHGVLKYFERFVFLPGTWTDKDADVSYIIVFKSHWNMRGFYCSLYKERGIILTSAFHQWVLKHLSH